MQHDIQDSYDPVTIVFYEKDLMLKHSQYELLMTVEDRRCSVLDKMRKHFNNQCQAVAYYMKEGLEKAAEFAGVEAGEVKIEWTLSLGYFYSVSPTPPGSDLVKQFNSHDIPGMDDDKGYYFYAITVNRGKRSTFGVCIDENKLGPDARPFNNDLLKGWYEKVIIRQSIFLEMFDKKCKVENFGARGTVLVFKHCSTRSKFD